MGIIDDFVAELVLDFLHTGQRKRTLIEVDYETFRETIVWLWRKGFLMRSGSITLRGIWYLEKRKRMHGQMGAA